LARRDIMRSREREQNMGDGASIETHREAIAMVLAKHLKDDQLVRQAVTLWVRQYETRRPLSAALTDFCQAVQDACGLHAESQGLFFELFKACQSSRRVDVRIDLSSNAIPVMTDALTTATTMPPIGSEIMPAGRALGSLHRSLMHAVLGRHRIAPHAWIHAMRQSIPVKLLSRHPELHDWLHHPKSDVPGNWTPTNGGADLVNAWYVAMSELLGPVEADKLLSRAVTDGESGAADLGISLRSFL